MNAEGIDTITITPLDTTRTIENNLYYVVVVEEGKGPAYYAKLNLTTPTVITLGGTVKGTVYFNVFSSETSDPYILEATVVVREHKYATEVTPPTCTEKGYTTYTCADCGHSKVDDYVNALGHYYGKMVYSELNLISGYCNYEGKIVPGGVHKYFAMDAEGVETITITPPAASGYNPNDLYYVTIVEDNGNVRRYVRLNETETQVINLGGTVKGTIYFNAFRDELNYVYVKEAIVVSGKRTYTVEVTAPTCSEAGYTTYTCACGDSLDMGSDPGHGHCRSSGRCTERAGHG